MIYASDLDRTLIYSPAALGVPENTPGLLPAESDGGRILSYISAAALEALAGLPPEVVFVPVTTRTVAQYRRIELFRDLVVPEYAVTSNGGTILVNGAVDEEWRVGMEAKVQAGSASAAEARTIVLEALRQEWIASERWCDEFFFTFVVHRDLIPAETALTLSDRLRGLGWRVSLQGRKLYAVPAAVSKSEAVLHISRRLGRRVMAASGDSLLDRSLLDIADCAIVPPHGEIYAQAAQLANADGASGAGGTVDAGSTRDADSAKGIDSARGIGSARGTGSAKDAVSTPGAGGTGGAHPGGYRFTSRSGVFAADEILSLVREFHERQPAAERGADAS
ncbi:hydrolase [Paenibacillus sp. HN-1]|uniref:HAD family hydrolase n=1 Tax=Paenibacillus TaxID=44249 RepID=UPI001CA7B6D9|nr:MULTISPECIES: HAD family hydrolase [Paenibacillus]MBY9080086.1 hydrolase [Paenibacillus sp. CGMCC 1.18879]MBY9086784.1 hydrolase [Paenibacillus sinensis]